MSPASASSSGSRALPGSPMAATASPSRASIRSRTSDPGALGGRGDAPGGAGVPRRLGTAAATTPRGPMGRAASIIRDAVDTQLRVPQYISTTYQQL